MNKNNIIKILKINIILFILINIIIFTTGYSMIDNKLIETKNQTLTLLDIKNRDKKQLLEDLNIENQSIIDLKSNLLDIKNNISIIKLKLEDIDQKTKEINKSNTEKINELKQLELLNSDLKNQKINLETKLKIKQDEMRRQALRMQQLRIQRMRSRAS